ncbi:PmbA/TldA family metallopeptidase, partial [Neisseria gonorrhoeae]
MPYNQAPDFLCADTMHPTYSAVQARLLEANRLSPELLAKSLCIIGAHHVDYADIYCQRTAYESWHLEEGIVKSGSFQIDQGVGVRAVSGDKTAFAYADSLCIDSINRSARAVRAIGAAGGKVSAKMPSETRGKP